MPTLISNIDWGRDDADLEPRMAEFFLEPSDFDKLRSGRKQVVIGRKGSGKTAIAKQLIYLFSTDSGPAVTCEIRPTEELITSRLVPAFDSCTSQERRVIYEHLWLRFVYEKLFAVIGASRNDRFTSGSFAVARDFALTRGLANPDLIELTAQKIANIASALHTDTIDFGKLIEKAKTELDISQFEHHVRSIANDSSQKVAIRIFIDDLDHIWDNSQHTNDFFRGLFLARNRIARLSPIRVACFLFIRNDMFENLMSDFMQSDKEWDAFRIEWNQNDDLIEILEKRISAHYAASSSPLGDEPFFLVFPEKVKHTNTREWLVERSFRRPRDLIQLARMYAESNRTSTPSQKLLLDVESEYSKRRLRDLGNEFSREYPGIQQFFESWRSRVKWCIRQLDFAQLKELLEFVCRDALLDGIDWVESARKDKEKAGVILMLFRIGVLRGLGGQAHVRDASDLRSIRTAQFHPVLEAELNIKPSKRAGRWWEKSQPA